MGLKLTESKTSPIRNFHLTIVPVDVFLELVLPYLFQDAHLSSLTVINNNSRMADFFNSEEDRDGVRLSWNVWPTSRYVAKMNYEWYFFSSFHI